MVEVSQGEISSVIQLVREVCDRWDDPRAWREHLLNGACRLLNGNVGTMFDAGAPEPGQFAAVRPIAIVELPAPEQAALVYAATTTVSHRKIDDISQNFLPGQTKFWNEFNQHGWVTTARYQLTDLATYYASAAYKNLRWLADCDDYLWSMRYVDVPRGVEMLGIDRPHGAPPFGPREITLLKLLHDEISPLIGMRLATEEHFSREGLSKRLREVLGVLLEGKSEKEVAGRLGLSPRTVHEYITAIYAHFKVSSRAELLAYFVNRAPKTRIEG